MIKQVQVKIKQGLKRIKLKVLCLSSIKVCFMILNLYLVANEVYEHDIESMQASL